LAHHFDSRLYLAETPPNHYFEHAGTCVVVTSRATRLGRAAKMAVLDHCDFESKAVRCPAVNTTRAESMFERHSTQQTSQAQPRPQEK